MTICNCENCMRALARVQDTLASIDAVKRHAKEDINLFENIMIASGLGALVGHVEYTVLVASGGIETLMVEPVDSIARGFLRDCYALSGAPEGVVSLVLPQYREAAREAGLL